METVPELSPLVVERKGPPILYSSTSVSSLDSSERSDDDDQHGQYPQQVTCNRPHGTRSTRMMYTSNVTTPLHWMLPDTVRIDPGAFQFALRMAMMLTVSALFVLVKTDTWRYPDGMWVLVSVLFVSWFPSLEASSVLEKIVQRLIGTFIGAFLGLSCGFFSIWVFKSRTIQAIFLEFCMFIFNFGIIFVAGQCKVGRVKVIRRYAYATILCVLTFCICILPFGLDEDPKWEHGVWRIYNVIVGCFLGALGAILVCPKSTTAVLHDKTARQVKLAGEASEAVLLMAADYFAGKVEINKLADEIVDAPLETTIRWRINRLNSGNLSEKSKTSNNADVALKKYEDAIADWKASKMLFPLTKFDPFHSVGFGREETSQKMKSFNKEIAKTLARSLRLQTTIVVLDGMVRNDAEYDFDKQELLVFAEAGSLIRRMLTLPLDRDASNTAALALFVHLEVVRKKLLELSVDMSDPQDFLDHIRDQEIAKFKVGLIEDENEYLRTDDDENGRGIPKFASNGNDNALFFLLLVEHLILRSLALFQAWKHVEQEASSLEDQTLRKLVLESQGESEAKPGDSMRSLTVP